MGFGGEREEKGHGEGVGPVRNPLALGGFPPKKQRWLDSGLRSSYIAAPRAGEADLAASRGAVRPGVQSGKTGRIAVRFEPVSSGLVPHHGAATNDPGSFQSGIRRIYSVH